VKLIADWGARSPGLDRLLAIGCMHCRGPVGRLVQHRARELRAVSLMAPRRSAEGLIIRYADVAGVRSAGFPGAAAAQRESEHA
jgi:hypothetical protein